MIIRFLTQNDVAEHDKITAQAFSYACDIQDPTSVLPCEKVLGAFDDNNKTLFADLEIHERKCNYDGGILTCAAIGGVAAKPEHRGKGAVKALFAHIFRTADYDISILYPFSEEYYRKLGYERTGYSVCALIPFSAFSKIKRNTDVRLYEGTNTEQLLDLYNACARKLNLCFVRENAEAFSSKPYASQKYTYIWKNNAFATIHIDRDKSIVYVDEFYYDSCASMLGVLGFLRNFESNQKRVCFPNIPGNTLLLDYVQDLKNCEITIHNTGAARILNIESVLKAHQYPAGNGTFTLQVGNEVFHVTYAENRCAVEKTTMYAPDVIMDIQIASKLLLCGITDASYTPECIIQNPKSDFFALFPPKTTFFSDAF